MEELDLLHKKNGEILDSNEWNRLVAVINYIIEFYNHYPTKLSEFENDIVDLFIGPIGPKGDKGDKGDTGPQGPAGLDGTVAFDELTSELRASLKGELGEQGPQGETGELGPAGADGKSAYELAVENGFEGTEEQWLQSLIGAIGKSAYELYVDNTSDDPVLTLEQWLASLHGTNGINGQDGTDGVTPHINNSTKHWMIGDVDTGIMAEGQNGTNGTNGTNGITPHIDQTSGNWMIGETDTGIKAQGPSGTSLSNETATQGGSTLSAVTTGEKYNWNNKASIWSGTQAQYDALSPNYDSNTIYIITAAS